MSQSNSALIWSCLDSDLNKSALFYGERYYSQDRNNHDAIHLYSLTLLRDDQAYSALHLVNWPGGTLCSGCLEINAKCCTVLGRHRQAREALEASLRCSSISASSSRTAPSMPEEAALRCRSGTMALKGNLPEQAAVSFREALALNPFLWEAFEGLCALGAAPEVDELFPPRMPPARSLSSEEDYISKFDPGLMATGAGFFTPESSNPIAPRGRNADIPNLFRMPLPPVGPRDSIGSSFAPEMSFYQQHRPSRSQPAASSTPLMGGTRALSSADESGPVTKKLRSSSRQHQISAKPSILQDDGQKKAPLSRTSQAKTNPTNAANTTRRSSRLQGTTGTKQPLTSKVRERRRAPAKILSKPVESEGDDEADVARSSSPQSVAHSPRSDASHAASNWTALQDHGTQDTYETEIADHYIYDLMRKFAYASRALARYESQLCLDELSQLPYVYQQSVSVLVMVGRAEFERQEYEAALRAFQEVWTMDPHRVLDMEVYSTLLWHLQNRVQLSYLAQQLFNINPRAPQAWIAVGNLFSLEKDRSQALTCFKRAVQMDPSCAYAYTLSGHECVDDDPSKAIHFFQSALRVDPRHYNAWYGLGSCYLRQSRLRLAEYHYRRALEIHPNNAILLGCVGIVLERRNECDEAMVIFDRAIQLSPDNALVRYRRAKLFISTKRYTAAIHDLEQLYQRTPNESNVVFQLAKAYRLIGDETKAAHMLAVARDISPRSLGKIRALLETAKDDAEDGMDG